MKAFALLIVIITGALLIYGTLDMAMPGWGDPNSPASKHVSPYYIKNSIKDTATPNIVTSILADYRSYDTLGETAVIFTAGVACLLILKNHTRNRND